LKGERSSTTLVKAVSSGRNVTLKIFQTHLFSESKSEFDSTMDIAKLLSRATKQNKIAPSRNVPPTKLPSAGTSDNPQLYHDAVPESRGKKRKRGTEELKEKTLGQDEDEGLNFFAPPASKVRSEKSTPTEKDTQATKLSKSITPISTRSILDEEECRNILRSHRLKITLLKSGNAKEKKVKKTRVSRL